MFERLKATLTHSTFWLAVCSIALNLAPYISTELAGYPEVMRWVRIASAAVWVLWLYLAGKLPAPAPPGILQVSPPDPTPTKKCGCAAGRDASGRFTK
jgi:hypothetical protein